MYVDLDGYSHNYEGFYEKLRYQMSINRRKTTITQGVHAKFENSLLYFLSLLVKSFEEEIQPSRDRVDITRG